MPDKPTTLTISIPHLIQAVLMLVAVFSAWGNLKMDQRVDRVNTSNNTKAIEKIQGFDHSVVRLTGTVGQLEKIVERLENRMNSLD